MVYWLQITVAHGTIAYYPRRSNMKLLICPHKPFYASLPKLCDLKDDVAVAILSTPNSKSHSVHDYGHR